MKLLKETLPDVSRSRMPRSWLAASVSFSRGQRLGLPLFVSVAGLRSICLTAYKKRIKCFSDEGIMSGIRSDRSWHMERTDSGVARGSVSLARRRVALIWFSEPSEAGMFHEPSIIHRFYQSEG